MDVFRHVTPLLIDLERLVAGYVGWMTWNTLLALMPLLLAARLFRRPGDNVGRLSWWCGVAIFVAFLPNAPYVLTDLVHLARDVPRATTPWRVAFVVVPMYVSFCAIGFGSYVVSLVWLGRLLRLRGWGTPAVVGVELALHALCSVGIWLGRFVRFNSWDLVSRPHEVARTVADAFGTVSPLAFITVFFVATCVLYWPSKHVLIALVTYVRSGAFARSHVLVERHL